MPCKIAHSTAEIAPIVWANARESVPVRVSGSLPVATESALTRRIAELEQRLQAEVANARKAGFEEGIRQTRGEATAEVNAASERLAQHLKEVQVLKRRIRNEAEAEVVRLALAIARRILNRELMADPDAIQGIAHAALQKLQHRDLLRMRVHRAAVSSIQSALNRAGLAGTVDVTADGAMGIGDLILETTKGELDASVDTQLEEIGRGFADRLALP